MSISAIMGQGHLLPASHCGCLKGSEQKPCGEPTILWLPVILLTRALGELVAFMPVCDDCQMSGFLIDLKDHHSTMSRLIDKDLKEKRERLKL